MIISKLTGPVVGGALAISVAGAIEGRLPVVMFMQAAPVEFSNGEYTAHVIGRKVRDCLVIGGTFSGWYLADGVWRETRISFPRDDSPDSTRPAGMRPQDFGLFQWHGVPEDATEVRVTNMHNCDGEAVLTTSGPFDIVRDDPAP